VRRVLGGIAALLVVLGSALPVIGGEPAEEGDWRKSVKNPVPWLTWGAEQRIRQEYIENGIAIDDDDSDNINWFRLRTRLWMELGPFFQTDMEQANGLKFFARLGYGPRVINEFPGSDKTQWNEVFVDQLYADWQRIYGLPISAKIGRQDIILDKAWAVRTGTPLEGGRSIFMDAARFTVHLDDIKSALTLIGVYNHGYENDALRPLSSDDRYIAEYNQSAFIAHFNCQVIDDHQFSTYYIHREDSSISGSPYAGLPERSVDAFGLPVWGNLTDAVDYYIEPMYQWGDEGGTTRESWAATAELGYTFKDAAWAPRVLVGYEYLQGDDPSTREYEQYDPLFNRYPRFSEVVGYSWIGETGGYGHYTNMQRITTGVHVHPTEKLKLQLEGSHLWADEHTLGTDAPFDSGEGRGDLAVLRAFYTFNDWASMHVWGEYFWPGSYYDDSADDAFFLRWQMVFKF